MIDYLEQKGPGPPWGAIQTYTILQCWDMWGESTGHRGIHKGWAMRRFDVFLVVSLKKSYCSKCGVVGDFSRHDARVREL